MRVSTVNISFKKDLLEMIDKVAKKEMRSRSELIREAARMYIERKARWEKIFAFGDQRHRAIGLSEEDLDQEIHEFRKSKRIQN